MPLRNVTRIERIEAETTGITADTVLRLGKALGTSAQLWMNLKNRYGHNDQLRASVVGVWRLDRLVAYSLSSSMTNSRHIGF
jgi:plasmid maintenance system antidote protein VapI